MEISFWNMWPACHADCSIDTHAVVVVVRIETSRGKCARAAVSRFEFSMSNQIRPPKNVCARVSVSPSCFYFNHINIQPRLMLLEHILRTFFAVANVKRSYKVRISFGPRLLFSITSAQKLAFEFTTTTRRLANLNSAFTCCWDVSRFSLSSSCKFIAYL